MNTTLAKVTPPSADLTAIGQARRDVQRALAKADRRRLTDAIREFAAYIDPSGKASTRPDWAYRNMTAMIYRPAQLNALQRRANAAGENARDALSESELEFLRVAERTTADLLRLGMAEKRTRKAIKADVRVHVERLAKAMQPSLKLAERHATTAGGGLA